MAKKKRKRILPQQISTKDNGTLFRTWCWRGIILFLFFLPWLLFSNAVYVANSQFFFTAIIFSLSGPFFLFGLWKGWLQPHKSLLWVCIVLLLSSTLFATIFSLVPTISIWGAYGYFANGLIYFFLIAYLLLWLSSLMLSDADIILFLQIFLVQSGIIALQTVYEVYSHSHQLFDAYRAISPLNNGDYGISYILLALPFGVLFCVRYFTKKQPWFSGLSFFHILLCLCSLFYLLPVSGQQVILNHLHIFSAKSSGTPTVAPTTVTTASPNTTDGNQDVTKFLNNPSNNERYIQWNLGWITGKKNLLHGTGPGTGRINFYNHLTNPIFKNWDYQYASDLPHNETLQFFSEQGIPGVIAYLFLWLGSILYLLSRWKKMPAQNKPFLIAILISLVLYLGFNQVLFSILTTGILSYILLFSAYVLSGALRPPQNTKLLRPLSIIVIILLTLIGFWSLRYWVADSYAEQAGTYSLNEPRDAQTASETAITWFPYESNYERLAAGYAFAVYYSEEKSLGTTDTLEAQAAESHIQRAVSINPFILRNQMSSALFQYLIASSTTDQNTAFQAMLTVIKKAPWEYDFYTLTKNALEARPNLAQYRARLNYLEKKF